MQRDIEIDFIRGVATISIIFIHTVFWSGVSYVPEYIRQASLFIDVPWFFVISGMVYSYTNKINIIKIVSSFISSFLIIAIIYDIFTKNWKFTNSLSVLFLDFNNTMPSIPVVSGSAWFIISFVMSCIFGQILISTFRRSVKYIAHLMLAYYIIAMISKHKLSIYFFSCDINFLIFYTYLYILGYLCYGTIQNKLFNTIIKLILLSLCFIVVSFSNIGIESLNFQQNKFPVNCSYISLSLLSISFMFCIYKAKIKNKYINIIGSHAIFYYVCQGVSSSFLYKISLTIHCNIWLKLFICFSINLLITTIFAEILLCVHMQIKKIIRLYF